jgi:hypothetical protein
MTLPEFHRAIEFDFELRHELGETVIRRPRQDGADYAAFFPESSIPFDVGKERANSDTLNNVI